MRIVRLAGCNRTVRNIVPARRLAHEATEVALPTTSTCMGYTLAYIVIVDPCAVAKLRALSLLAVLSFLVITVFVVFVPSVQRAAISMVARRFGVKVTRVLSTVSWFVVNGTGVICMLM